MGANHNPENGPSPERTVHHWAFGHYFSLPGRHRGFHKLMAFWTICDPCDIVPHFSNPNVIFRKSETGPRAATGIANQRDNARTLNLTAHIVANYRQGDWLYADRFENRDQALSGSNAKPPLTQAETCRGLEMLLPLIERRLKEMADRLDRRDEIAVRRYTDFAATVDSLRKRLKMECQ